MSTIIDAVVALMNLRTREKKGDERNGFILIYQKEGVEELSQVLTNNPDENVVTILRMAADHIEMKMAAGATRH